MTRFFEKYHIYWPSSCKNLANKCDIFDIFNSKITKVLAYLNFKFSLKIIVVLLITKI